MTVAEVRPFLPQATRLTAWDQKPALLQVEDASGQLLGFAGRTSPAADDLIGFQGPTDTLFVMDAEQRVLGIAMRRSYDTTEYLPWVTDDKHFMTCFNGKSLDELANLDPAAAGIEGVSGATMTSMSMAYALARAAKAARDAQPAAAPPSWTITARDWGTAGVVLGGLLLAFTRLRGQRLDSGRLSAAVDRLFGIRQRRHGVAVAAGGLGAKRRSVAAGAGAGAAGRGGFLDAPADASAGVLPSSVPARGAATVDQERGPAKMEAGVRVAALDLA